jgi:hypothetical protein
MGSGRATSVGVGHAFKVNVRAAAMSILAMRDDPVLFFGTAHNFLLNTPGQWTTIPRADVRAQSYSAIRPLIPPYLI